MKFHLVTGRMLKINWASGGGVRKKETSFNVGGIAKWCSHNRISVGNPWKTKIKLTYDSVLIVIGRCLRDLTSYSTDTFSAVFSAVLFMIVRKWKQPICTPSVEWIMRMWCKHTMEYYLAVKKNLLPDFWQQKTCCKTCYLALGMGPNIQLCTVLNNGDRTEAGIAIGCACLSNLLF